ncbi:MAG: chloride channel protein [Deltaproteobacteria bacterium]|nr:chloride channel protein [Deltaproteobacteria bacterium]
MTEARHRLVVLIQWLGLGAVVGVLCGTASALFLYLLDLATAYREHHVWMVFLLPPAGLGIGWLYQRVGDPIKGGNNLVIDTIHDNGPRLPLRMAPMVLVGTVLTHLFGGSAGREGTAVQMGASLADAVAHRLHLGPQLRRHVLAAGVAGGFGSVFGTPIAGVVFGLEFVVLGHLAYEALVPALIAAVVGDMTTRAWGVTHAAYTPASHLALTPWLFCKWAVFALAIAITTGAFIELTHYLKRRADAWLPSLPLRMACGGALVVGLWQLLGTTDYLGLGVPVIVRSFHDDSLPSYAFALKLLFTAVTLGAGFLGGEVTPLFFVGAALGNALAGPLGLPLELAAAVGMAAVFASASNAPLALSVMAIELVGANVFPHAAIVCVLAYLLTGHRSIYPSQRVFAGKTGIKLPHAKAIKDWFSSQ